MDVFSPCDMYNFSAMPLFPPETYTIRAKCFISKDVLRLTEMIRPFHLR